MKVAAPWQVRRCAGGDSRACISQAGVWLILHSLPLAGAQQQIAAELECPGHRLLTKATRGTATRQLSRGHEAAKDVLQAEADAVRVLPSLGLAGLPILVVQALLQEQCSKRCGSSREGGRS